MPRFPLATLLSAVALLAACSAEPDPEPTALRDAIQAPQDKARATEAEVLEAAEKRKAALEDQGG
jgi:hypothetical protein